MNKKLLRILGIILIPFMYLALYIGVRYVPHVNFSWDLIFITTLGIIFVSLHFFIDIKKMYTWIFKWRILIGIGVFTLLVLNGYNGSSIASWSKYIDTDVEASYNEPVLGIARGIRSDEWLVQTPNILSQLSDKVNLSSTNSLINNRDTKTTLYLSLPNKSLSILLYPEYWGFLFLPKDNAFSFYWYLNYFVAFFVVIELFMILTKKNKLYSVLGAFLTVICPPAFWWNGCAYILYGSLALLLIYNFIKHKDIKTRLLLSIGLGLVATKYVLGLYPAWFITYGFIYAAIFLWMIIDNKKELKWKDSLYLIISITVCLGTLLPLYLSNSDVFVTLSNTVYPGTRQSFGGDVKHVMFTYFIDMFYPYTNVPNPCEWCQYLSLFPFPILMSLYALYKNYRNKKKMDYFLLFVTIITLFLTVWCMVPLPKIISKLTLMTYTMGNRAQLVANYGCTILLIYIMSRYELKKERKIVLSNEIIVLLISVLYTLFGLWMSYRFMNSMYPGCVSKKVLVICGALFIPVFYCVFKNSKKYNFVLFILLMFINIVGSVLIMPINKGLDIIYEKPFAKEIQSIVKEDEDARFLAIANDFDFIANYILANGGNSIMSTNYIPNIDLWHRLDSNESYNDIYNRYAHVITNLTDKDTSFELVTFDHIKLNLNYNDICKTDATYIASSYELDEKEEYYSKIYGAHGEYIYKAHCE